MVAKEGQGRRRFLRRASAAGALVLLAPLSGCGSGKSKDESGETGAAGSTASGDPCSDLTGLTPQDREVREEVGYLAETPIPGERCDNCAFWEPVGRGATCGGCSVVAGPIHPSGYCDLWEGRA